MPEVPTQSVVALAWTAEEKSPPDLAAALLETSWHAPLLAPQLVVMTVPLSLSADTSLSSQAGSKRIF